MEMRTFEFLLVFFQLDVLDILLEKQGIYYINFILVVSSPGINASDVDRTMVYPNYADGSGWPSRKNNYHLKTKKKIMKFC